MLAAETSLLQHLRDLTEHKARGGGSMFTDQIGLQQVTSQSKSGIAAGGF
jgi:hypothetical protein